MPSKHVITRGAGALIALACAVPTAVQAQSPAPTPDLTKGLPFGQDPNATAGPNWKMQSSDLYAQDLSPGVAFTF